MLIDFSMKLLMPSSFENIKEIAFRTMASASKTEIKKVLESLCGLKIEKVRTPYKIYLHSLHHTHHSMFMENTPL